MIMTMNPPQIDYTILNKKITLPEYDILEKRLCESGFGDIVKNAPFESMPLIEKLKDKQEISPAAVWPQVCSYLFEYFVSREELHMGKNGKYQFSQEQNDIRCEITELVLQDFPDVIAELKSKKVIE